MSSVLTVVALRMGGIVSHVEELLNGQASTTVALALGTSTAAVQQILDGTATPGAAAAIGLTVDALREIEGRIGRHGLVGLVMGAAIRNQEIQKLKNA